VVTARSQLRQGEARRWGAYASQARIASGLVLFAFATTHFVNHAFGLISLDLMQWGQDARTLVTRSLPGTALLITAATVHFLLGLAKFLRMRAWRVGLRSAVQLGFGLLIPVFMVRHVLGTRGVHELFGVTDSYAYALWAMWPGEAVNQAALMVLVWVHGCLGLHHWLVFKPWYRRTIWYWYGLAVAVPALGYAGYVAAGRVFALEGEFGNPFLPGQYETIQRVLHGSALAYFIILGAAVGLWLLLLLAYRLSHKITVRYANGPLVLAPRGATLLEISRSNRIPHASVCGGRARCSTCRVRIIEGLGQLPPAAEEELRVLKRVGAPANVRLACQLRPVADLAVSTLLPANIESLPGGQTDQYHWGVEQDVTILFCDLRGFTRMSEGRLSFDVVFLLNQFLGRMAEAIEDSGGYVDKFMGDGIMAIFGMGAPIGDGARDALAAARAMGGVLDGLNLSLRDELPAPLQVGIGIHTGPAILGRIGASDRTEAAARITALGETVNIASRLEGMTKDLSAQLVVSQAAIAASGVTMANGVSARNVEVRGLSQPLAVHVFNRAADVPEAPRSPPG
jgi:adenylate cyclase